MNRMCELYRHFDKDGRLLYVGIAFNVILRLRQHKHSSSWYDQITRIEIERFPSRKDAVVAEATAITDENPIFNIRTDGSGTVCHKRFKDEPEKLLLIERGKRAGVILKKSACLVAIRHSALAAERGDLEAAKSSTAYSGLTRS